MKEKQFLKLSVSAILIVFLAACSKTAEYTSVIPADATSVVSIDLKALSAKAELGGSDMQPVREKILSEAKGNMSAEAYQYMEKVMANPNESGIDLTQPIYWFNTSTLSGALIGKVADQGKLKATFDTFIKENNLAPLTSERGLTYISHEGGLYIFNQSTMMIAYSTSGRLDEDAVKALFKQEAGDSFTAMDTFTKMGKQACDINYFFTFASLPDLYASQLQASLPDSVQPKDMGYIGGWNFEDGRIRMKVETYMASEETKKLFEEQQALYGKMSNKFAQAAPENSLSYIASSLKGEKIYQVLAQNRQVAGMLPPEVMELLKSFIGSLDGEIAAAFTGVEGFTPLFFVYADVKDGSGLKAIYDGKDMMGLRAGMLQMGPDEYMYRADMMTFYFGVKDKVAYFTNALQYAREINKAVSPSVKEAAYASEMDGKLAFMVVNAEEICELPLVKMVASSAYGDQKILWDMANDISYLSIGSEGLTSEASLVLKDQKTNALKQIVNYIRKAVGGM
ncbi:MAG: DUF4836 family protein [Mediterranea sp.]|jgi:hypothetical protein|nr:DUF4836 family protein [Mediterranea sp.]